MNSLTIVMYHYVRELKHSRYPEIKGLTTDLFKEQIAYLKKYYNPISAYDLMDAIYSGSDLPPKSLLLTFDDAYVDHFTEVYPVLDREKISGCFFPPAASILNNRISSSRSLNILFTFSLSNSNLLFSFLNAAKRVATD